MRPQTKPQTAIAGSNSLPDLAARIRAEHEATADALKSSVQHALAARDLLTEAKTKVPHGQWLPWLTDPNAQEASWREDCRRLANGEQVNRVAGLAMVAKRSVDFCGYWQRHLVERSSHRV